MSGLIGQINPGLLLVAMGLVGCLIKAQRIRQALLVATPVVALVLLALAERGTNLATVSVLDIELILYKVDSLNFIFGLAFLIAAFLNGIYALHTDDRLHDGMSLAYAGAAVSAVFVAFCPSAERSPERAPAQRPRRSWAGEFLSLRPSAPLT